MNCGKPAIYRHDDEWIEFVRQHQPVTATGLSKIMGNTPSNCMHRLRALAVQGVLDAESRVEQTSGSSQRRRVVYYSIALSSESVILADRHDTPWRPAVWIHPIRRAYLENRRVA